MVRDDATGAVAGAGRHVGDTYLMLGGSLDPEPDPQSPFFDEEAWRANLADGRPGVRVIRRGGV